MTDWQLYGTKEQQLEQLKEKLYKKRAGQPPTPRVAPEPSAEGRRRAIMEEQKRQDQIKEAQQQKKEKLEEKAAKKRVLAKIEADKAARKARANYGRQLRHF
ncbi:hypothetical protein AC578_7829 [Pseudocercospora eumusae]|uniref:rRNA-processing protein n=1 Tax=Pseudocercospora eumusae TaxID=321146 RepID=A0A139HJ07_9PEZI|nr:hypothetical protein AC578_7829 [Pseudocercospora eumusae]